MSREIYIIIQSIIAEIMLQEDLSNDDPGLVRLLAGTHLYRVRSAQLVWFQTTMGSPQVKTTGRSPIHRLHWAFQEEQPKSSLLQKLDACHRRQLRSEIISNKDFHVCCGTGCLSKYKYNKCKYLCSVMCCSYPMIPLYNWFNTLRLLGQTDAENKSAGTPPTAWQAMLRPQRDGRQVAVGQRHRLWEIATDRTRWHELCGD